MDEITIEEMSPQNLEDMLVSHTLCAVMLGFNNSEEMEVFKCNAAEGMIKFGGSFCKNLGYALAHADTINTTKIIKNFRQECDRHANLWLKFRENIENNDQ